MTAMSWDDAIVAGMNLINHRCREQGIEPLSGHDIAIIAAHRAGAAGYAHALAASGGHPEFNNQAAQYAAKLIAKAILC